MQQCRTACISERFACIVIRGAPSVNTLGDFLAPSWQSADHGQPECACPTMEPDAASVESIPQTEPLVAFDSGGASTDARCFRVERPDRGRNVKDDDDRFQNNASP